MKKLRQVRKNVIQAPTNRRIADGADGPKPPTSLVKAEAGTELQKAEDLTDLKAQALKMILQAGGVKDPKVAAIIIDQVRRCSVLANDSDGMEIAFEMMREMNPKSLMEAQLAAQMHAVHNTALTYLAKATSPGLPFAGSDANVARATDLMRLYREQIEAMLKLKGQTGQQKVTVEHVHVHQGGQAIVGSVSSERSAQGEGGSREKQTKTL
jgi:hypothetical protein